jgi:hypothetical protein
MGLLNVNDLKPGMVLAEHVTNKHGNMLVGKGNQLSEKHIGVLKAWGVTEVNVDRVDRVQVEREEIEALAADVVASIEGELKELFPDFGDDPIMQEIYRVVKKFKIRDMSTQKTEPGRDTE